MHNIPIKTKDDIKILRDGAKILKNIVEDLKCSLKSGITTKSIDVLAEGLMNKYKVQSAFKGYRGFPATVCVSINQEIVHGIPSQNRFIKEGDIVSMDCGLIHNGFYADMAVTLGVGQITDESMKLLKVTEQALYKGIENCRVGNHLSNVSCAIQRFVEENGFSVVREFVGHGIGRRLHEDPEIPNYGYPEQGSVLKEGMVFCLEPMVNMGGWKCKVLQDGWTAVTLDGKPSAHFEHMVAITNNGPLILTQ